MAVGGLHDSVAVPEVDDSTLTVALSVALPALPVQVIV